MTITIANDNVTYTNDVSETGAPAFALTGNHIHFINTERGRALMSSNATPAIVVSGLGSVIDNALGGVIGYSSPSFPYPVAIQGGDGSDEVYNHGVINGRVSLGLGNDRFSTWMGASSGFVSGVDLGAGNDQLDFVGVSYPALYGASFQAEGGTGTDKLVLSGQIGLLDAAAITGFEVLEIAGTVSNAIGFSGYSSVILTSGSVNFMNAVNPGLFLNLNGVGVTLAGNSQFGTIVGGSGADWLEILGPGVVTGAINLGQGDDWFNTAGDDTAFNPGRVVLGGTGYDYFNLAMTAFGGGTDYVLDLANVSGFERFLSDTIVSGATISLAHMSGFTLVTLPSQVASTIAYSDLSGASVAVYGGGSLLVASSTTIGNITITDPLGSQAPLPDPQLLQSVAITVAGTVLGNVHLSLGDDSYDSRLGTTTGSIFGYAGNDTIHGDAQADVIDGGYGADDLFGEGGDDVLIGADGFDRLYGGSGDDHLYGGTGPDLLDGGSGYDWAHYDAASAGVTVDLVVWSNSLGEAAGDNFVSIEGIVGSAYADNLRGNEAANWIYGGAGDDVAYGRGGDDFLLGGGGADWLYGNDGNDSLYGEAGNDYLIGGAGIDVLFGGDGNDVLFGEDGNDHLLGGSGANQLDGGAGFDYVHYSDAAAGVTVNLATGTASNGGFTDSLVGIEGIVGSGFADTVVGDSGDNWFYGNAGNDSLQGQGGNDVLVGGLGDDTLDGGDGNDWLYGGDGNDVLAPGAGIDAVLGEGGSDTVSYAGASSGLVVDLANSADNTGWAFGDLIVGVENLLGSAFADSLRGDGGANTIDGGAGDDWLYGRGGNDVLIGGTGVDRFFFGAGDGKDRIADFAFGAGLDDIIMVSSALGVSSFAQVMAKAAQVGADVVITFDPATSLTLTGVQLSGLVADDFGFY